MTDTPYTVAVVDDDPGTVDVLTRYFTHHGFRVVSAVNGVEALALVGRESPNVLILDVMMPALDGFEVAERLSHLDPPLPIIMLSAKVDQADKIRGLMTGASRYLSKPCSPARVLEEVSKLLGIATGSYEYAADKRTTPIDMRIDSGTETNELDLGDYVEDPPP